MDSSGRRAKLIYVDSMAELKDINPY